MATSDDAYDHGFSEGTLVDGRYEIRKLIGSGGMGAVYRANDMKTGHRVAVKMLHTSAGKRSPRLEERRRRLLQEVVLSGRVGHANVVKVQDFGFFKDTPYIVMEFLEGRDLGQIIEEQQGPLSVEYVADVMLAVCSALRACHGVNVIHRDLKPSNIMIINSQSGLGWEVKVVDFGISKVLAEDDVTEDGRVLGTAHYLAPEQLENQAAPASDQYAIGVLLHVLLTNRLPYGQLSGHALHRAIFKGEFTHPCEVRPDLPKKLGEAIVRAMRRSPEERFPSVYELGQALWEFGSALGRENWKKYYFNQTPNVASAKMSTVGVPLIAKILQGGGAKLERPTELAHYDSTTSIGVATVDDGVPKPTHDTVEDSKPVTRIGQGSSATVIDATLPAPSSVSHSPVPTIRERSEIGAHVVRAAPESPSIRSVEGSPDWKGGAGAAAGRRSDGPTPRPESRLPPSNASHAPSARRATWRTPAIVLTLVSAAALGVAASWLLPKRAPVGGEQGGPHAVERAARPAAPAPAPLTPPPAAENAVPAALPALPPVRTAAAPAADTASPGKTAKPGTAADLPKPKHHRTGHRARQETGSGDWTVDASGNPIPPP